MEIGGREGNGLRVVLTCKVWFELAHDGKDLWDGRRPINGYNACYGLVQGR